jgi:uncharacterized protein YjbJ (UPF0337 family)
MNEDILQGKWKQFKGEVQKKWGEMTDDELDQIEGQREKLAGKLQEKYGWTKEKADEEINNFVRDTDAAWKRSNP